MNIRYIKISRAFINFKGSFANKSYNFNNYKKVDILKREIYSLIQTDKGQYKPKDLIKFRLV